MCAKKKSSYTAHSDFIKYQKFIVSNPAYAGMPDVYCDDGSIQWEAPSNRSAGKFKDTHDKRDKWWRNKAKEIGISPSENQWISKVAKAIHPTQKRPCKKCGRIMDIRYLYLNSNLIKRIQKLGYDPTVIEATDTTSILDFLKTAHLLYGNKILADAPVLLKCAQAKKPPAFRTISELLSWTETSLVPLEPSILGPGCMANPPDRFDGFHSFNRCCRQKADTGRSKENLASYATDRRAFEFWSDGNWITANKLMGLIRNDPLLSSLPCHCRGDGHEHPTPCSADHIGPISLGFMHRPVFQLLCKPCNSAKNNRMFLSDVIYLRKCEDKGESVVSWYARSVWDNLKEKVKTQEDATRLSRVMRDNRFNAMVYLGQFFYRGDFLFLYHILDLSFADYAYSIARTTTDGDYVSAEFKRKPSTSKYRLEQKARKVRVAFESLRDYLLKEQRNGQAVVTEEIQGLLDTAYRLNTKLNESHSAVIDKFAAIFKDCSFTEENLAALIQNVPDLSSNKDFTNARCCLEKIMDCVGRTLAANWNSARYCRDLNYDGEFIL